MKQLLLAFIGFLPYIAFSQADSLQDNYDRLYREDQFYASISYNLLSGTPESIKQNGISTGFHFGFIRDMPINTSRRWAIGLGFGVSTNSYNQNLQISETTEGYSYAITDEDLGNITKNKFTRYLVEFPFELRWRSSSPSDYKFWRIYSGFKVGYLLYNTSKFRSDFGNIDLSNIDDFEKWNYGLTLSAGYGTWNFQLYYGLNSLFDESAQLEGEQIDLSAIKIGIMFYIL
ncbi:porin family protein [Winogradskyella maritima]|uniref:Porin family protein n=1 Tax=Winogradskyella maritima TaxID=1517766 RepID=A0ABV8AEL7_9FLAO|nr:porin family protein [Winogradskyella maritima]